MPAQGTFNKLRILAGVLLVVSLFLPLYTTPTSWSGAAQSIHVWDVGRGDPAGSVILALAYIMPAAFIILHRRRLSHAGSVVLMLSEPLILAISAVILLTAVHSAFALLPLFAPWFLIPATATIGPGAWMALAADGMLASLWLAVVGWHIRGAVARIVTA